MMRRMSTTTRDDDVLERQRRRSTTATPTTTTTRGGCAVYDVLNPHLSAREVMRRRGYEVKDHLKENAQKIRAQSERNARYRRRLAEEEEEVRRRRGRGRGEGTTTSKSTSSSSPCESRVRADLEEAAKRGAKRVASVEQRAARPAPSGKSFGTTPKYLAERKATLLRELNEKMERALEDIEKRRTERALERQLERAERRKRDAERRARLERRARVDAEKLSPIERAQRAKNVETARLLFARAHLRVDDFLPPPSLRGEPSQGYSLP
jgi:hypothetical protein